MGEGEHVPIISQVFQPLLDGVNHTHFVIQPGQLFGCGALQSIEVMQQQVMNWRDNKGFFLYRLFMCGWSRANHEQLPCG